MLYAIDETNTRIKARPSCKALCPLCKKEVIAKCGEINTWHWAHKSAIECDTWAEGETEWHLSWKSIVKKEFCEVKIGNHRADIKGFCGVIELQNSPISTSEIKERENHYKNMIWLFKADNYHISLSDKGSYCGFIWKWPRKSIITSKSRVYFDLGNKKILEIKKIRKYPNYGPKFGGWGYLLSYKDFLSRYFNEILKEGAVCWLTQ